MLSLLLWESSCPSTARPLDPKPSSESGPNHKDYVDSHVGEIGSDGNEYQHKHGEACLILHVLEAISEVREQDVPVEVEGDEDLIE